MAGGNAWHWPHSDVDCPSYQAESSGSFLLLPSIAPELGWPQPAWHGVLAAESASPDSPCPSPPVFMPIAGISAEIASGALVRLAGPWLSLAGLPKAL